MIKISEERPSSVETFFNTFPQSSQPFQDILFSNLDPSFLVSTTKILSKGKVQLENIQYLLYIFVSSPYASLRKELSNLLSCQDPSKYENISKFFDSVSNCGSRSSDFFDFLSQNIQNWTNTNQIVQDLIQSLIKESETSSQLPNSLLYEQLASHIDVSACYLDLQPCNICTNPEQIFSEISLSEYRSTSKYTHDSINVQLSTPLILSTISLNLTVKKSSRTPKVIFVFISSATIENANDLLTEAPNWRLVGSIKFSQKFLFSIIEISVPCLFNMHQILFR